MSTVYIVESGEYSAYQVDAIFETEEMAAQFVAAKGGDGYRAWELNTWRPEQGRWYFQFSLEGATVSEMQYASLIEPTEKVNTYSREWAAPIDISVETGDRERAVKIASERYARIMSQFDNAKTLIEKAADWYTPYPPGPALFPQGMAVQIAEILAGIAPLPVGSEWTDARGKIRYGYSTHAEHIYRIMGVPYVREPQ